MESIKNLDFKANGANIHNGEQHFRIGFAGGGFIALSAEPEQVQVVNPTRNGINVMLVLQKKIADINNDLMLSDMAKNDKICPLRESAAKHIAGFVKQVLDYDADVARREAAMFVVPAIDRKDAVTFLEDDSIRQYYFGLKGQELRVALDEIQKGNNSRALLALLRSPIPLPSVFNEVAFGTWEKSIRNEKLREVSLLHGEREAVEWAQAGMSKLQLLVTS